LEEGGRGGEGGGTPGRLKNLSRGRKGIRSVGGGGGAQRIGEGKKGAGAKSKKKKQKNMRRRFAKDELTRQFLCPLIYHDLTETAITG